MRGFEILEIPRLYPDSETISVMTRDRKKKYLERLKSRVGLSVLKVNC